MPQFSGVRTFTYTHTHKKMLMCRHLYQLTLTLWLCYAFRQFHIIIQRKFVNDVHLDSGSCSCCHSNYNHSHINPQIYGREFAEYNRVCFVVNVLLGQSKMRHRWARANASSNEILSNASNGKEQCAFDWNQHEFLFILHLDLAERRLFAYTRFLCVR